MPEEIKPELKDIIEMIHRYNAVHKNNVCFLWSFVGFKKDSNDKCVDCGGDCDMIDDTASRVGAYGDRDTLQVLVNELQELIILEQDENGFVNV